MIWSDEFEGDKLDTSKWEAIDWTTPFNKEWQAYHPSQVTVSGGNLALTAVKKEYGGKAYTSGKVESKWARQYGRWEVRAKLPATQGTWPAIWLLPDPKQWGWPSQGEIDIMENRGHQPNLTSSAFHFGADPESHLYATDEQRTWILGDLNNYHQEFHVYAVEWDKNLLRFFVDDVHYFSVHSADVQDTLAKHTAPMEVLLNVAVGGTFVEEAPPGEASVWPQQMLVDYVRVYEREKNPPPVVFKNGGFEQNKGSLANWTTFGNTFADSPNVQIHDEAVSDGLGALKLFGQFNSTTNYSGVEQAISVRAGDSLSASVKAFVRSADSIAGSDNRVDMKFDYYRHAGGKYGSPSYLSSKTVTIADGSTVNDQWIEHTLTDKVPDGAVEARLGLVFAQPSDKGGAVHLDEIRFENLDVEFNADANGDGRVDGLDLMQWQQGVGKRDGTAVSDGDFNYDGVVDNADREVWEEQYGGTQPVGAIKPLEGGKSNTSSLAELSKETKNHLRGGTK